jgi:hypothetical protein
MTILTASTPNYTQLTDMQKQSALMHDIEPERHIVVPIREDYERPASWFKIQALIHHLPNHKAVLWVDADALLLRKLPSYYAPKGDRFVELCKDANGWNCGVMLWVNTPKAFEFLWRIYDSYDTFRHHPWFEQASFQTMAEAIAPHELTKHWNCYEGDKIHEPYILHFPAKSFEDRLSLMTRELLKLQNRP